MAERDSLTDIILCVLLLAAIITYWSFAFAIAGSVLLVIGIRYLVKHLQLAKGKYNPDPMCCAWCGKRFKDNTLIGKFVTSYLPGRGFCSADCVHRWEYRAGYRKSLD